MLASGDNLGPYEILSPLGAGAMGEVYRARDTRLDRGVAIKVLPSHLTSNSEFKQRFEREAKAISSLTHPNICTLHDIGHEDGVDYLVMELIEGETLAQRLSKGRLPPEDVLRFGVEIASALDRAHRVGIVHRDLKPGNVMVTNDGHVKVLDFGLAKSTTNMTSDQDAVTSTTQSVTVTRPGSILGTPAYMSPEQARGLPADQQADVWAFGCILFECLTGSRPFYGTDRATCFHSILNADPDWSLLPAGTIDPIRRVLRRCLAKDKSKRQRDLGDAVLELDEPISPPNQVKSINSGIEDIVRERSAFQFIVNSLLASGNLQVDPPIQAAQLQSMSDVHETCQYIFDRYVTPRLLLTVDWLTK